MPSPSEESDEPCAIFPSMSSPEIIKSAPRSLFPIRVSDQGPKPFDLESQERVMRWKHLTAFEWFPVWEIEPDLEIIKDVARYHLGSCGFDSDAIMVEYFAGGTHNKLYTINTKYPQTGLPAQCLLRIAMPIYPWYKVESDVATTEFVRHFTDIPVPVIYAYDSSSNNKLGLEWMLMEKVSGSSLEEKWTDMSLKAQTKITTSVADWVHQLSSFAFDKIGNLYMRYTETNLDFYIGPMVEPHFYDGRRLTYKIDRGPFPSLQTYYNAILDVQQQEVKDPRYLAEYQRLIQATEYGNADYGACELLKATLASRQDSAYGSDVGRENGAEDTPTTDIFEHASICDNITSTNAATCDNTETVKDEALDSRGPVDVSDIFIGKVLVFGKNMLVDLPRALEALRTALPSLVQEPGGDMFSTILMHHDISTDNILVDGWGELKALVDWEMVGLHPPVLKTQIPHFLESFENSETPTIEELELWGEACFLRDCKTFILTKLRKAFRGRLEELQSRYLLILEEPSGLHKALYERIFDRWQHHNAEIVDWVEVQLAPTDDESNYQSDDEDDGENDDESDGIQWVPLSDYKEKQKQEEQQVEEVDLMELGIDGDDNKLACKMARVAGEKSESLTTIPSFRGRLWLCLVEFLLLWSG